MLLLATFFTLNSQAQDIDVSKKGVVSVNGKDQFIIEGKQGMVNTQFTITNMDGDELMGADATQGEPNMTIVFTGREEVAVYPLTIGTKKVLAKELAKMKVIQNGQINEMGLKRFLAKYGAGYVGGGSNVNVISTTYEIVDRNVTQPIFVMNGEIKQDFKVVGHYDINAITVNYQPGKAFKFYSPATHTLIASVNMENFAKECDVMIYKNHDNYRLLLSNTYTDTDVAKAIAEFLISNGFM